MSKTTEQYRSDLITLLQNFDASCPNLREKVLKLIPVWDHLSALGTSMLPHEIARSGRKRLLHYFRQYPKTVLSRKELAIVAGIDDWPRRVRELRQDFGWNIASGLSVKEMIDTEDVSINGDLPDCTAMAPDDYIMLSPEQDRDAAHRWKIANDIRKGSGGAQAKILAFLLENVGKPVSGEELRYVTKDKSEWARRTRELRTEEGWQICTHWNGRPDLPPGMYVLESTQQLPAHDRKINDKTRREVLVRDNHVCQLCGWSHEKWNPSDPRHLELHHIEHHASGGANEKENLKTLCNICHDQEHKKLK
ncbi:MAG: HNH endonuclease [Kiritimatiellales bacterium]